MSDKEDSESLNELFRKAWTPWWKEKLDKVEKSRKMWKELVDKTKNNKGWKE